MAAPMSIERAEEIAREAVECVSNTSQDERARWLTSTAFDDLIGDLDRAIAFAHRDRVRKRTAFKHGVQFRAARKVMR